MTLKPAEIGTGWTGTLLTGGDQVPGQVTLDLCGAQFPSEALRTARRQTVYLPAGATVDSGRGVSNEVVTYRAGGAEQARTELLAAVAGCPTSPQQSSVNGVGLVTTTISSLTADPRWLPGTVALRMLMTGATGTTTDTVAIYQFRGNVLAAVYGSTVNGAAGADELRAAASVAEALKVVPAGSGA